MPKLSRKRLIQIAVAAVLVWTGVEVVLVGRDVPPMPPGSQPIVLRGGRVFGNHISTRSWNFDYDHAQMSPDGTYATLDGVHHGVLYKKGKPYLAIAAQHVAVNTQTFDFTSTGDVHVDELNPKDHIPKSFDTDLMQWSNATKMLSLPHQCLFRSDNQLLRVASITVDFNKDEIHFGKIEGAVAAPAS